MQKHKNAKLQWKCICIRITFVSSFFLVISYDISVCFSYVYFSYIDSIYSYICGIHLCPHKASVKACCIFASSASTSAVVLLTSLKWQPQFFKMIFPPKTSTKLLGISASPSHNFLRNKNAHLALEPVWVELINNISKAPFAETTSKKHEKY